MYFLRSVAGVVVALSCCSVARAHDPGLSALALTRAGGALELAAGFANADFAAASRCDRNGDGRIDAAELAAFSPSLSGWLAAGIEVRGHDGPAAAVACTAVLAPNGDVELAVHYEPGAGPVTLSLPLLGELAYGHRCYVRVVANGGGIVTDALLHRGARALDVPVGAAPQRRTGHGAAFFALGIEHILTGFDHLAFLLALLAAGVTLGRALATISAFTLAHSATLVGAALGIVHLPDLLVEAAIAGSIVAVAALNLVQRAQRTPHRWPVALLFGLVHGFGFAGALADLPTGGALVVPVFAFNLGVEVGQLAFAAAAVPLIALAARRCGARAVSVWLSVVVGLAGCVWLFARLCT